MGRLWKYSSIFRCLYVPAVLRPMELHTALHPMMLTQVCGWLLTPSEMVLTYLVLSTEENLTLPKTVGEFFPGNCRGESPTSDPICGDTFATYLPEKGTSLIQPMIKVPSKCNWASFTHKLVNCGCTVCKSQASFDLMDALYTSVTAWKDIKGCYPMRNLSKTLARTMLMKNLLKEELEGCTSKKCSWMF